MDAKCLSYLYALDLLSLTPQLRIFNQSSYKTTFSLLFTMIIILISIALSIYLLVDFFRFENPVVIYTKENDKITNRTIKLKDTFFIFGLFDYNTFTPIISEDLNYTAHYVQIIFNGSEPITTKLTLEICEFGKNIDMKYKQLFEENKILDLYSASISDFYCISSQHENLTISNLPNIAEYLLAIVPTLNNNNSYKPENVFSLIITEQDLIEHNNRDNPLNNYYALIRTPNYNQKEFTDITISLQYIKYEADNKLILRDYEQLDAKSYVKMEYIKDNGVQYLVEAGFLGEIKIGVQDFFDHYKRSYTKLQALFAQALTIINFLFTVGQKICDIFLTKKMAKDIIGNILKHKEYINEIKYQTFSSHQNNKSEINFNDKYKNKISFEICNTKEKSLNEKDNLEFDTNIKIKRSLKSKEIENNKLMNSKKIEKLNNLDIIKSFFCYNNKKTILINKCCDIINKDICIENILKKIYELENIYYLLSAKEENKLNKDQYLSKRFKEVNNLISQINFKENYKNNNLSNQNKINDY